MRICLASISISGINIRDTFGLRVPRPRGDRLSEVGGEIMKLTDAIVHAGAQIKKDKPSFWKEAWPFLKGGLIALLIYGVLAFLAEVVFASTV